MDTAIKHPVPDRVKPFVIFDIRALLTARMSKITNDGLTRSGTGWHNSCTHMETVGAIARVKHCVLFLKIGRCV